MSAYNPPKNQPPIFDTTQFYNQEQEHLNYPIAQGTETFQDIIVNNSLSVDSYSQLNGGAELPNGSTLSFSNPDHTSQTLFFQNNNNFYCQSFASNSIMLSIINVPLSKDYIFTNSSFTCPTNIIQSGNATLLQSGTGQNILKSTSITNLSVSGNLVFTGTSKINQTASTGINLMSGIIMNTNSSIFQSGAGKIDQSASTGTNIMTDIAMNNHNIYLNGSGIIDQTFSSGQNIFNTMKFNNSTTNQQITFYEVDSTNYAENYSITINPYIQRYNVNSTGNHIFSWGSGTTYTDIATINTAGLTMNGEVSLRDSHYIELLDSTNTISSYIAQTGQNLDIQNNGSGSVIFTSPNIDFTNTYCNLKGAGSSYFTHFPYDGDNKNYITGVTNFREGEVFFNQGTITFNKLGSGSILLYQSALSFLFTNANYGGKFYFTTYSSTGVINTPLAIDFSGLTCDSITMNMNENITMGFSSNLIMDSGPGVITQTAPAFGSEFNTLKATKFYGNTTINSGNSVLFYNSANTGYTRLYQSGSTFKFTTTGISPSQYNFDFYDSGGSLYTFIMSPTGVISPVDFTLPLSNNLILKDIALTTTNIYHNSGNCYINNTKSSGNVIITTKDSTTNTKDFVIAYTGVTCPSNFIQTGTSIIDQSSSTGGTNTLKNTTFISGSVINQYDPTGAVYTSLSQSSLTSYLIENMYNTSTIIFRTKNATGTAIDHSFAYNRVSINSLLQMGSNFDIIFQGTGKIDQTSSTGQNIFNTMKFNTSITNKQITLYENSTTNLATNFTISIESATQRYNVNTGSSHIFSFGSGISTYTNIATINSTGLTMGSNRNVVQSGTGIVSQTGTGINLMKNITQNVDCNLLQSGIGVITQSGTGTNALKGTTFSANNTHYNGSAISQYDSTNIYNTQLSQVGANYFISNAVNGGATYIRNLTLGGSPNDIAISATDITMAKNTYIQNSNVLVLTDGLTGYTQTNINQSGGSLFIQNLTPFGGYIYINAYDGTSILDTLVLIHYTAFSLRKGVPLRVWNSGNAYYTELSQSGTTSYLTNTTNGATTILRTTNSSGTQIENITMTPTTTTIKTPFSCENGIDIKAGNVLKIYETTNTYQLQLEQTAYTSQITNYAYTSAVTPYFNLRTTNSAGTQVENIKMNPSNVQITTPFQTDSIIKLQSAYTSLPSASTNNLGYIGSGAGVTIATPFNYTSGTPQNTAVILLPAGVWLITAQSGVQCGGTTTFTTTYISLSNNSLTIDNNHVKIDSRSFQANSINTNQITRTFESNAGFNMYLVMQCNFSTGTMSYSSTIQTYTNIYATRIG